MALSCGRCVSPKAAAVSYGEALKRDPRNARWWRYRGNAFLQANQIQAALKAYNRSLKLESKNLGSWHNRADCRACRGKPAAGTRYRFPRDCVGSRLHSGGTARPQPLQSLGAG
ncbi:MAG: tetratricopeptide repeat protein [Anaerolineae bacterium]|nr:tetratricopeptide repeat protein [Anaerolineae bacterium]